MKKIIIFALLLLNILAFSSLLTQEPVVKERKTNFFREYDNYLDNSQKQILIPGLKEGYIPQGLAYIEDKEIFVISYYHGYLPSVLTFIDGKTSQLIKSFAVLNADGSPYTGHAGGVAVSKNNLWISSGSQIHRMSLKKVYAAQDSQKVKIDEAYKVLTRASFMTFHEDCLWVGEFFRKNNYPTHKTHHVKMEDGSTNYAWIEVYEIDPQTDEILNIQIEGSQKKITPDIILSIPDIVQGISFSETGEILLSLSYGRTNDSTIQVYENVIKQEAKTSVEINDSRVPLWILNQENRTCELKALPMSEGIFVQADSVYVLYESAAKKYKDTTKYATDYIWSVSYKDLCDLNDN